MRRRDSVFTASSMTNNAGGLLCAVMMCLSLACSSTGGRHGSGGNVATGGRSGGGTSGQGGGPSVGGAGSSGNTSLSSGGNTGGIQHRRARDRRQSIPLGRGLDCRRCRRSKDHRRRWLWGQRNRRLGWQRDRRIERQHDRRLGWQRAQRIGRQRRRGRNRRPGGQRDRRRGRQHDRRAGSGLRRCPRQELQ